MKIKNIAHKLELQNLISMSKYVSSYSFYLLFVCCLVTYLQLFQNALIDDTFITLTYSRNILAHGVWGLLNNQITNTATSPLNVLQLTILGLIFGDSPRITLIATFIQICISLVFLEKISKLLFMKTVYGRLSAILLVLNPLLISTIGLESYLYITLIILCLHAYLVSRWKSLAILLGLLTITRPDGILFLFIFLIFLPNRKLIFLFLVTYVLSILPWFIFSWFYLGSFIPDTFFIKSAQSSWENYSFVNGEFLYFNRYPFETIVSFSSILSLFFLFIRKIRQSVFIKLLLLLIVTHYLGYSVIHVPPYRWYYAPEIALLTLLAVFSFGLISPNYWKKYLYPDSILWGYTLFCTLSMGFLISKSNGSFLEMPIHTNWATQAQYKELGMWLKERCGYDVIQLQGEIGTIEYYSDCFLIDPFSDRNWVHEYTSMLYPKDSIGNTILRINNLFYKDTKQIPQPKYSLMGFPDRTSINSQYLMVWNTSSKWLPETVYYFYEISE